MASSSPPDLSAPRPAAPEIPVLTDRAALALHRARAARTGGADFLHQLARDEVQERLSEVTRTFTNAALVTGHPELWSDVFPFSKVVADTPVLALEEKAHDLVIHAMSLHWADDPVGQLIQCARALTPDGLLMVVGFGGRTLAELRACLAQAESEITGGLSPRILPMAEIRDLGALLQRAGLALPVADSVPQKVTYPAFLPLLHDLRAMGETNALAARLRRPTPAAVFARAAELYAEAYAEGDRLVATFELIFLTGWAPAPNQQKPLRPGSALSRLSDALGVPEQKI